MKNYKTKDLILLNVMLLIPLIIYGIFKNGYLLYQKDLIGFISIFRPLYFIFVGLIIKFGIDLIRSKKIIIDYDVLYVMLMGMIVPYNTNLWIYFGILLVTYIISIFLEKYIKFNKVCFVYLIIILISFLTNNLTFKSPLDINYSFNFDFWDLLMGRMEGGISSTSILFSFIGYIILITNFYYKKDISFYIILTYILFAVGYFLIANNNSYILNSELIFGSIFISSLPCYSPYKVSNQIIYAIIIGILSFVIAIILNPVISIYLVTFIVSLFLNIKIPYKKTKTLIEQNI